MDIKIIGTDLDGTALSSNGEFTQRTLESFERAADLGVTIVVATGRARRAIPKILYDLPYIKYVITSNGARILDIVDNKTIYESFIAEDKAIEACKILRELDANIEIFVDGEAYISRREFDDIASGKIYWRNKEYILSTRSISDNIFDLMMENASKIENVNINYYDFETKKAIGEVLEKIDGVTLTSSVPLNHEIEGENTNKGSALSYIMNLLKYEKENLLTFGDNPNDIEMIKLAGIGVAVGNAEDIVKDSADYITLPNHEDGVADAIEKFVLNTK